MYSRIFHSLINLTMFIYYSSTAINHSTQQLNCTLIFMNTLYCMYQVFLNTIYLISKYHQKCALYDCIVLMLSDVM